jgi:cytochrome c
VRFVFAAMGGAAIAAAISVSSSVPAVSAQSADSPAFYTQKVRPILMKNCGKCHFNMNHKGGLAMDTKALIMKGGRDGVVIVPGNPDKSVLLKLMKHQGPPASPKPMPPKAPKMSDADIAVVEQWIKAGAVMPNDIRR